MKKPLLYKAVAQCINIKVGKCMAMRYLKAIHVCGLRLLQCAKCNRIFCPDCDCFGGKISDCCKNAVEAYHEDNDEKESRVASIRYEVAKRCKRGKQKFKIKIEEIHNGNKL